MHRVIFKPDPDIEVAEHTAIGPAITPRAPVAPPLRYRRTIAGVPAPLNLPITEDDDTVVIDDPDVVRALREVG